MWITVEDGFVTLKLRSILVIYLIIALIVLASYLDLIPVLNWLISTILILGFIASILGEWGGEDVILHRPLFYFGIIILFAGAILIRQS